MPYLTCLYGTEWDNSAACSLPFIQISIPYLVVILICCIREHKLPVQIFLHSLHKAIAYTYRQVSVGHLTHRLLNRNKIQQIRMPVINHQHQRTAAAAALLDQACRVAEQSAP
ncbi:hypothetical protein D3C73_980950 [compost metagenome]